MRVIVLGFVFMFTAAFAGAVEVPSEIEFAGMQLRLTEDVRRLLKADIDLITKSPKGYQLKVERANLYFPVIEGIFREENLPEDFKFLALQESSLVPDAVSSSNAVGYWQFKKESAMEVGLRVDHQVDERMNIVAASRGAARYLKKNNSALNNWIYALLSYNLGLGGVKSKVEEKYIGARKMTIDKNMHWYVIRFLAHKLAYQDAVGKDMNPSLVLVAYTSCRNKSLKEISKETEIEQETLESYNKWVLRGKVPEDKEYHVILPVTQEHQQRLIANGIIQGEPMLATNRGHQNTEAPANPPDESVLKQVRLGRRHPQGTYEAEGNIELLTSVNRVRAIKAREGDTPAKLALQGGIGTEDFLKYNEMKRYESVVPGRIYYLQPKRSKALVMFHTVEEGETMTDISQKYAVKVASIRIKNRMSRDERLIPGRVLWLRSRRPKNVAVEVKKIAPRQEVKEVKPVIPATPSALPVEVPKTDTVAGVKIDPVKESHTSPAGYHLVKQGETLYGISRQYGVSVDSVKYWNNLTTNDIKPGNSIIIRKGEGMKKEEPVEQVVEHIVEPGETMYQISRKFGVSVTDIQKWNNKQDYNMSVGEKIIIRKKY